MNLDDATRRHKMHRSQCGRSCAAALAVLACALPAAAPADDQGYPQRPVRFLVGYAPGGSNDIVARILAQKLAQQWGSPVVVDNRPGAAGNTAAEITARSQADGYTMHLIGANNTINANLSRLSYDIFKDFEHVVLAVSVPLILVVPPSLGVHTVPELVAYAKANPRQLNYASSGTGSISQMAAELFKTLTKTEIVHVPYQGSSPGEVDLMAGRVHMLFTGLAHTIPLIKAGKLRGLAVTSLKRVASAPDLPTVAEAGVPNYESSTWYGLVVRSGTPARIVGRINKDMNAILAAAEVQQTLTRQGLEPAGGTSASFTQHINSEMAKWARVVKDAGLKLQP